MIDLQSAQRFLSALASKDGRQTYSFQTFVDEKGLDHETKEKRSKELTRTFHGTFEQYADQLVELNKKGAGVFVCVNRTDGGGIRGKNIDRVRSFFVDDDSDHLSADDFPVKPSIVVRTKRGQHFYWLMSNGLDKGHFGPAQKALAERFGTDPSVFNLNRVMRIPGFMHNKGDPYPVTLDACDESCAYELDDIAKPLGLELERFTHRPRVQVDDDSINAIPMERRLQRAAAMLRTMGGAVRNSGEGHAKTLSACRVGNDFAIPDFEFLPLPSYRSSTSAPSPPSTQDAFLGEASCSTSSTTARAEGSAGNINLEPHGPNLLGYSTLRPLSPAHTKDLSSATHSPVTWSGRRPR
jgi:hypothetical protein